jgi:hypothetical protein
VVFFHRPSIQSLFGENSEAPNKHMKEKEDSEKLIGKLMKKRKEENEAFIKLLHAIESKTQGSNESRVLKNKQSTNHKSIL